MHAGLTIPSTSPANLFNPYAIPTDEPDDSIFDLPEAVAEPEPDAWGPDHEPEPDLRETVELYPFQKQAVAAVLGQFKEKINSTLVVSATGTGKTIVLAELARLAAGHGHGVLIIVHTEELIGQIIRSCARMGVPAIKEKAKERVRMEFGLAIKVVCASRQTLRGDRLASWGRNDFRLIITDEAYHVVGPSYRAIYDHFQGYRHVGFTATADRLDGKAMGQVFESLAFEYNLRMAIADGWLVPIEAMPLITEPRIDLRDLRITAGDFNRGDLEKAINENIGVLVNAVVQINALEDRRTIAFTPDVSSAEALAHALSDVGIKARHVSGAMTPLERAEVFKAHRAGEFQVLTNCMIATEGYDDKQVSAILMCRPTKSRALYSQMAGRGTRPYPTPFDNIKPNCRIVDLACLTGKHQLVVPVDLYDHGDTPDEVVETARKLMAGGERNLDLALDQAQAEYNEARRVRIQWRMVSVRASTFDPVSACELFNIPTGKAGYDFEDIKPATSTMVVGLRKFGINVPDDVGWGVAHKLLNKCFGRMKHGLASPWDVAKLIEGGIDPDAAVRMRQSEAKAHLEAHPPLASSKQVWKLRSLGVPESEAQAYTRKQASQRIDKLMKGS